MTREEINDFCEMKSQLEPENEDIYNFIIKALEQEPCEKATFIPKNATNGDIIKALFPKIDDNFSNVIDLKLWWNAPYRAESEGSED